MHQKKQCNEVYRNNRFYPFTEIDHDSCTHYRHHDTDDIPAIFPVDFPHLITNFDLSLTFYHILSQNSILRLPKSSLPTALSAHIYTLSFNTISSAHAFILFINPTHFIRSCIFSCSVTPCFSSICFTKVSTCSLAS